MSKDTDPRGGDVIRTQIKEFSKSALSKGVGNSEFGALYEIEVKVSPSIVCSAYADELYMSMLQTIILASGNPDAVLPFKPQDLYMYLMLLMRERIRDVRKQRTLFRSSDQDVKIPHFYYLALYELGDVVDENRHIHLTAHFDGRELERVYALWEDWHPVDPDDGHTLKVDEMDVEVRNIYEKARALWVSDYQVYGGEREERDFIYTMSRHLKMLERIGFVNGSALPRGLTGELSFMLFLWMEGMLKHPDPDVEPGQALLASLLAFSRNTSLLNPYISYGPEAAYRVLLKEVTLPRSRAS
jgi:hypothetical protein